MLEAGAEVGPRVARSDERCAMVRLRRSLLEGLTSGEVTIEVMRAALQCAIELEHSTIPLYLYALYSLVPDENREVAAVLRSVVIEEMLHMVLAANVLNAIGGEPAISKPDFVPRYPGHLPGGVEGQVAVHLRPFSREQLETFIEIEEPRDPLRYQAPVSSEAIETCTIGEFYLAIESAMATLADDDFDGAGRHQVGPDLMFGSIAVTDLDSARRAIDTIIEQGEGTATSPEEIDGPGGVNDFAHYYRLREIQMGRRLVRVDATATDEARYAFAGEVVTFRADGVYPLPVDPRASHYPVGTTQRRLIDAFNLTYTSLLEVLHTLLNGANDAVTFRSALALMSTLERQAQVMATGAEAGVHVGPTFEYHPR